MSAVPEDRRPRAAKAADPQPPTDLGGSRTRRAFTRATARVRGGLDSTGAAIQDAAQAMPDVVSGALGDATKALGAIVLRVPARLEEVGSPATPTLTPWRIGFGEFLAGMPGVPRRVHRAVRWLDRFGSIGVSGDAIEVDGKQMPWAQVTGVTFGSAADAISTWTADVAVERLNFRGARFPGRKRLMRWSVNVLATICLAVAAGFTDADDLTGEPIPIAVNFRRRRTSKEVPLGLFAVLIATSKPGVGTAIMELAQRNGIPVITQPPSRAISRGEAIGEMARGLLDRGASR